MSICAGIFDLKIMILRPSQYFGGGLRFCPDPKNLKKLSKTENFESTPRGPKHALGVFLGAKNNYLGVFSPRDIFLGLLEKKIFFVFLLSYPYLTIFGQNGP